MLLVDFDPQGNLTQAAELEHTAYSAIKYFLTRFESQLGLAICSTPSCVDLVPTSARLNLANDELAVAIQRDSVKTSASSATARPSVFAATPF